MMDGHTQARRAELEALELEFVIGYIVENWALRIASLHSAALWDFYAESSEHFDAFRAELLGDIEGARAMLGACN